MDTMYGSMNVVPTLFTFSKIFTSLYAKSILIHTVRDIIVVVIIIILVIKNTRLKC